MTTEIQRCMLNVKLIRISRDYASLGGTDTYSVRTLMGRLRGSALLNGFASVLWSCFDLDKSVGAYVFM